jgi:hypothetical protein
LILLSTSWWYLVCWRRKWINIQWLDDSSSGKKGSNPTPNSVMSVVTSIRTSQNSLLETTAARHLFLIHSLYRSTHANAHLGQHATKSHCAYLRCNLQLGRNKVRCCQRLDWYINSATIPPCICAKYGSRRSGNLFDVVVCGWFSRPFLLRRGDYACPGCLG